MRRLMESWNSIRCDAGSSGSAVPSVRIFPWLGLLVAVLLALMSRASAVGPKAPADLADPDPHGTPSYEITSAVIAGGGITRAENPCFELSGTSGQPVAGASSNATYALYAGFWGGAVFNDTIFRNTFEACAP
jgi:hypothetical protein